MFLNKWVRQIFQFVYTFQIWHLSPKNKQFDFLSCVIKFKVLYGQGYVFVIYLAVFLVKYALIYIYCNVKKCIG